MDSGKTRMLERWRRDTGRSECVHVCSRRRAACCCYEVALVCVQVAHALARRVRGSHVAEMAETLGVDLQPVARKVADGGIDDSEALQAHLQDACKVAIDAYMAQQGDEGQSGPAYNLPFRNARLHTESCVSAAWRLQRRLPSALQCPK